MRLPLVLAYYGTLANVTEEGGFLVQAFSRRRQPGHRLLRWNFSLQDCFDDLFSWCENIFVPLADVGRVQGVNWRDLSMMLYQFIYDFINY